MHRHKLERVLVVNDAFELRGLITVKDITKQTELPNAARTRTASCASAPRSASARDTEERVEPLVAAGVDAIVVDTAHGHTQGVLERVAGSSAPTRRSTSIGGNIATGRGARRRWSRPAPTRSRSASARARSAPRASSPASACRRSWRSIRARRRGQGSGVPLIADGGVRYSGDIAKAIAAGASVGDDGQRSSPAPRRRRARSSLFQGRTYKSYRGMGSIGAMQQGSADRYFQELESAGRRREARARGHRGPGAVQGPGRRRHLPDGRRPARLDALLRLRHHRGDARSAPSSSRSPRRASARATSTTCRSPRKRRTTVSSNRAPALAAERP